MATEGILVAVRARPLNEREKKYAENGKGWLIDADMNTVRQDKDGQQPYTFDRVFGEDTKCESVYASVGRPVVKACLDGINGTVFAYGQTSSGKTYSMRTIMDMGLQEIFAAVSADKTRKYTAKVSQAFKFRFNSFYHLSNDVSNHMVDFSPPFPYAVLFTAESHPR